jgi:mRNA-degrading endonuclease toxin of MazEF toxin-antitoxin module
MSRVPRSRIRGSAATATVVVPATSGHLIKRVFFALEVPDGKNDEEQVKDSGSAKAPYG